MNHLDRYTETIKGVSFDLIFIKGGTLMLGKLGQQVTIPDFWIGETLVTQELWEAVLGENPSRFKSRRRPVDSVSWYKIQREFLPALNKLAKQNNSPFQYQLPSEPCWEYAASAGESFEYAGSDDLHQVGWYSRNSHFQTKPVKLKKPNAWGLYDMSGNLFEWTNTRYHQNSCEDYIEAIATVKENDKIVLRGGSWSFDSDYCCSANRNGYIPSNGSFSDGFRFSSIRNALFS
ncbi:formylglycine-generating enzyme family protein [Hugenholtzia roseola]|uniref:formylglycine-generating enzyme family protein n=1 Tax=Hugenholtzia roseola TaxID=1002 RepID=UPI0004230FB8|nr:formylglycine-generating enzyme family protein [Hugenholtzia roseola]